MELQKLYELMNVYFSISQEEVDKALRNLRSKNVPSSKLDMLLYAVVPYCTKWLGLSADGEPLVDEKLKRKAGKVILEKLNYNSFPAWENEKDTYKRLTNLFDKTSARNINIYKILYCSVLTDGDVYKSHCLDAFGRYSYKSKIEDGSRDFDNLYMTIKRVLQTTDEETVEIFEKCGSTIIGKCTTDQIENVCDVLCELFIFGDVNKETNSIATHRIFSELEVREILKNTPSLFDVNTDQMRSSFKYINNSIRVEAVAGENIKEWEKRRQLLRNILKNDPSLFKINASVMQQKEKFLKYKICEYDSSRNVTVPKYFRAIDNLFKDPISLGLMNVIKFEDMVKYYSKNITILENLGLSYQQISSYIEKNPFMTAMNSDQFAQLMQKVLIMDKSYPQEEYMERFLEQGRSLFKNTSIIEEDKILSKLQKNVIIEIDLEDIKPENYVHKFLEVFEAQDKNLEKSIELLIEMKQNLKLKGEKTVRRNIRRVGEKICDIPKMMKDEKQKISEKRSKILTLASDVSAITQRRLYLSGKDNISATIDEEKQNSLLYEVPLNELRGIYDQKRFHIGKRYSNSDELFERMMNYLGKCFDDKKAIADLFEEEVAKPYSSYLKQVGTSQANLFGENVTVEVDPKLKKPFAELTENITKAKKFDEDFFEFVSKRNEALEDDKEKN